jgi:3-dehydroshikimate dehydratase
VRRRPRAAGPRLTAMPEPYLSLGLCSVTLRTCSIEEVVEIAAGAALECIEWGADVHVPPGDVAAARRARAATLDAGLRVASYGSYWRCSGDYSPVLASARELGAPRVRIWAGTSESSLPDVAAAAREAARSIDVAFEFHGGTLTEDINSALALVEASGVPCYWQPPQSMPDAQALAGLRRLPDVPAVHVFSWWPGSTRLRLREREALWRAVFAVFTRGDALLEFVPGDDPALVAEEAEACRAFLSS